MTKGPLSDRYDTDGVATQGVSPQHGPCPEKGPLSDIERTTYQKAALCQESPGQRVGAPEPDAPTPESGPRAGADIPESGPLVGWDLGLVWWWPL